MKVVIVGGGSAGMLAGISAAKENNEVVILEKMNTIGKKLRITGKGRCNITNAINIEEFISNIPGNGKFLYSAFQNFTNQDIINLLKKEGLDTKVERGNRVFPVTDNAQSVIDALHKALRELKVKIICNAKVTDLIIENRSYYWRKLCYTRRKKRNYCRQSSSCNRRDKLSINRFNRWWISISRKIRTQYNRNKTIASSFRGIW